MKKLITLLTVLVLVLVPVTAEKVYKLDTAITEVGKKLSAKLPAGTKVVIFDIRAEKPEATAYIVDGMTYSLLDIGKLVVVDRENLEAIRAELSLQSSGEVSDESAQRLGAMLGAQTLITGSFEMFNGNYRYIVKAVKVETAEIQFLSSMTVAANADTEALFGRKTGTSAAVSAAGRGVVAVADFTGRLICSTINPFLGIGSFMQGDDEGGGTVVFWELAGLGAAAYGSYRINNDQSNGEIIAAAGGVAFGGAIIYSIIRPWTYNRSPKVTAVLDNVRIQPTAADSLSVGYLVKY